MKQYDWLVVGGGFQGIIAASLLSHQHKDIAILERMNGLGGVLRGKEYEDFILDFGCHLFNNDQSDVTKSMLEILGDDYHPVPVEYASITHGHKKEEIAVPNFDFWPEARKEKALNDILENAQNRQKDENSATFDNLKALLLNHYGEDIGPEVCDMFFKFTGYPASELSPDCILKSQVGCIHLMEDEKRILPLKQQHPEFDKVVALPSQKDKMRFYREAEKKFEHRNYYPKANGMRGFAISAENYFKEKNIDLLTGKSILSLKNNEANGIFITLDNDEEIYVKNLIWTLDAGLLSTVLYGDNVMKPYLLNVPMSLFYFFIPKEHIPRYTYIHDFSTDTKIYRASCPGFYGHQYSDDGLSYVCAEVPTKMDSDIWKNPENYTDSIWQEMKEMSMVSCDTPIKTHQFSTPVSYPMTKAGYLPVYEDLAQRIKKDYPNIINVNANAYSKNDIVRIVSKVMKEQNLVV